MTQPPSFPSKEVLMEHFRLTRQQARVALLLAQRLRNKEIAQELHISPHTARHHTEAVLLKLGIHSRTKVRRLVTALADGEGGGRADPEG